jgi:tRNA pseudouridine55 synthase
MATGVLVVATERATRLLTHLTLTDKAYTATIRLGASTTTDDADGEVVFAAAAAAAEAVSIAEIAAAMAGLTGDIMQRPASVSAIKVDGRRAYAMVRDGEDVELPARPVSVPIFELIGSPRSSDGFLDLDVSVQCSSGTYIRALARDLGVVLGVGGHLRALRRCRVGPFTLDQARSLEEIAAAESPLCYTLAQAIAVCMPVREITQDEADELSFGRAIAASGIGGVHGGLFGDTAVALLAEDGDRARPVVGFTARS